jgi:hypothetical protein
VNNLKRVQLRFTNPSVSGHAKEVAAWLRLRANECITMADLLDPKPIAPILTPREQYVYKPTNEPTTKYTFTKDTERLWNLFVQCTSYHVDIVPEDVVFPFVGTKELARSYDPGMYNSAKDPYFLEEWVRNTLSGWFQRGYVMRNNGRFTRMKAGADKSENIPCFNKVTQFHGRSHK